ncbi:hypothetical protein ACSSS7_007143 [Eimeria intestinalis]
MTDRGSSNSSRGRSNSPSNRSNTSSQPMQQPNSQEEKRGPAPSPPPTPPQEEDSRKVSAAAAAAADVATDAAASAGAAATPLSSKFATSSSFLHKAPSTRSQVSFSEGAGVGGLTKRTSMTSGQFMSFRQRSSMSYLLPSNFFQSQADIRTWGVEDLTDPSIQPYDKDSQALPRPFHTSLPGYSPRLFKYVLVGGEKGERESFLGPEISVFPPTWIPQFTPNPHFKAQRYGYNWEDSDAFKMDRLPYVNAEFDPVSAEVTHMPITPPLSESVGGPPPHLFKRREGGPLRAPSLLYDAHRPAAAAATAAAATAAAVAAEAEAEAEAATAQQLDTDSVHASSPAPDQSAFDLLDSLEGTAYV